MTVIRFRARRETESFFSVVRLPVFSVESKRPFVL